MVLLDGKFHTARKKFAGEILFELSWSFHPMNTHNNSLVRLSLENLYHNLFSDLDLEHPDRFYRDFSIWRVSHHPWLFGLKNNSILGKTFSKYFSINLSSRGKIFVGINDLKSFFVNQSKNIPKYSFQKAILGLTWFLSIFPQKSILPSKWKITYM